MWAGFKYFKYYGIYIKSTTKIEFITSSKAKWCLQYFIEKSRANTDPETILLRMRFSQKKGL